MDRIIGNHGLDHITEQIFAELDTPSLIQCCCVSKLNHPNLVHGNLVNPIWCIRFGAWKFGAYFEIWCTHHNKNDAKFL